MEPGTVVAARYRIEPFAARGGMGTVHRAVDLETGAFVALKTGDDDPRFGERFARERRLLEEISHPGIVRFVGSGHHEGRPFLAMEWIDGCDLAEALARGPLTVCAALRLCERVASALSAAHARGVVHRDVKPKNLMLVGGSTSDPKLTDFGIARLDQATRSLTQLGTAVGTPGFMAPEQVQSAGEVDARADVFSLGCVLFACITGRNPYAAETAFASMARVVAEAPPRLHELWPEVPRALDDLCATLMAKSPDDRPRDGGRASELLAMLLHATDDEDLRCRPKAHLGTAEQRLTSAVFVELAAGEPPHDGANADTLVGPSYSLTETAQAWVRGFGREVIVIGPTTFAVLFDGVGAPTDLAAKAIACALGLSSRVSAERILVVTAARDARKGELGELAERAENIARGLETHAVEARATSERGVVFLDDTTASLCAGLFSCDEQLGCAFRVAASRTSETALPVAPIALVGRARERDLLELMLREAFDEGAARAVLLDGEIGCGKTRLVDEVLTTVTLAFPTLQTIRLKPRSLNLTGSVDLFSSNPGFASGDAFVRDVLARTARGPVVVFVDDLRFADRPSLDALGGLVAAAREAPLVVLGALRPEDRASLPRLWHEVDVIEVPLAALGRAAIDEAIHAALGASPDSDVARRVHEGAGGNALCLVEMLRAVKQGRSSFPESVLSLASARLQELGEHDRTLLRAASVFGETFWARGVATMLSEQRTDETERGLRALAQRGLLVVHPCTTIEGELELSFKQAVVREAAYASLVPADRALAHGLAADWLSANGNAAPHVLEHHRARAKHARDEELTRR